MFLGTSIIYLEFQELCKLFCCFDVSFLKLYLISKVFSWCYNGGNFHGLRRNKIAT